MATPKAKDTELPLIQIDDEVREMTPAEYETYLQEIADIPVLLVGE